MDVEKLAKTIAEVKARQDILQCISRYAHGVDRLDREMLEQFRVAPSHGF
jgi:hypothetical protein